jgi:hypothetical protein
VTFQSAINNGVSEIYDQGKRPGEIVSAILAQSASSAATNNSTVQ